MTVHIYMYLNNKTVNCLNSTGGTHSIERNSAAKDITQFSIEKERFGFLGSSYPREG